MGRRSEVKHCINCNMTLPDRYKGRQRIYCSPLCRKVWTSKPKEEK
jgi:hypothetical protein